MDNKSYGLRTMNEVLRQRLEEAEKKRDYWHDQFVLEKQMRKDSDERAEGLQKELNDLKKRYVALEEDYARETWERR